MSDDDDGGGADDEDDVANCLFFLLLWAGFALNRRRPHGHDEAPVIVFPMNGPLSLL